MTGNPQSPPALLLPGWARWTILAVFAALIGVGLVLNPAPLAAAGGAVAIAAAAVLAWNRQGRYGLAVAVVATAGVAVLGNGDSRNVGWFTVCVLGIWCA